jgi:hypothetical protein
MVELVAASADITIAELRDRVATESGVSMSWSTVRRSVDGLVCVPLMEPAELGY